MPEIGEIKKGTEIGKSQSRNYSKYIWQTCIDCGKQRWVQIEQWEHGAAKRCRLCSLSRIRKSHVGQNNPAWKGGRFKGSRSYILVKLAPSDFFYPMQGKDKYVLEHRLIMAKHVKRCLLPWEVVHHKNGIRDDNRLENLELLGTRGKHNTAVNKRMKELERITEKQATQIKLLQFQIQELENKINIKEVT